MIKHKVIRSSPFKLSNDILEYISLVDFSKNHFIKKCPNCSIITEKIEGCNHITCSKCSYQWCWLCNGKYNPEHFNEGKCKEFQFFKPKNQNDIKLAFEGKISLNASQRQIDTFDELDININHRNRNRIILEAPSQHYLFKWGKITRTFLLFIYIFFGYDLITLIKLEEFYVFFYK